jgi:hypothetical protein
VTPEGGELVNEAQAPAGLGVTVVLGCGLRDRDIGATVVGYPDEDLAG